jgi:hypothetical protein
MVPINGGMKSYRMAESTEILANPGSDDLLFVRSDPLEARVAVSYFVMSANGTRRCSIVGFV